MIFYINILNNYPCFKYEFFKNIFFKALKLYEHIILTKDKRG